jgi:hypothetical protein
MTELSGDDMYRALPAADEALDLLEVAHDEGIDAWLARIAQSPPRAAVMACWVVMLRKTFEDEAERVGVPFSEVVRQVRLQAMNAAEAARFDG